MNTSIRYMARLLVFTVFLSAFSVNLFADWDNFIINYGKNLYGKGSQTWQIASYNENWVYFANKNGVLQYDGNSWSVLPLKNGTDVRSVLPSMTQKRIYAGGINEFGYFEPDEGGRLVYISLSQSLTQPESAIGNVWGIHEADNILYMQGDRRIIKLLNGKYTVIDSNHKIDCSGMVRGVLYIGTDNGVMVLVGNTLFPLNGAELLKSKRIRGIIPHRTGVMVITAYDGLFYCDGETTVQYKTGIESFLSKNEIFCAATSGDVIALGTVHKGIVLVNRNNMSVKYFNENNGLQNNTVLSLAFDPHGNLWAGLDSGIDYICLSSPLTNLYSYPHSFGTGYDAALFDGKLYLATNRGLYYTQYPVLSNEDHPDIRVVPQSSGQVWSLRKINDQLFCLHDRGVFLIEGLTMKKIGTISGAWTCQLVEGTDDWMYVGVYDGLYLLRRENKNWTVVHKIQGTIDSFRFFQQESARVLWLFEQGRCLRFELDADGMHVVRQISYGEGEGLPYLKNVYINKVDDKLLFSIPHGIYKYNMNMDRLEPDPEMNEWMSGPDPYFYIKKHHHNIIGLSSKEICISSPVAYGGGRRTNTIPIDIPMVELVQGAETLVPISDSLVIIPNDYGFALAGIPSAGYLKDCSKGVSVRNVYISHPRDSLIYTGNFLGEKRAPEVPYSRNSVRFEYGISSFTHGDDVSYQYKLDNDEWSALTKSLTKEYSNLSEGNHVFEVRAVFADAMSNTDTFTFRVMPPWYLTNVAYVSYFILFFIFICCVYKWDDIRVKRKKEQAVVEKDKELQQKELEFEEENARKERQIIQLEKEKLEHDLHHKSQEMANLMINFVRKNEILTEIKSDLFKVVSAVRGKEPKDMKQMLLVVSNKIDSNIQSDDVLKRIEEQFDLIHNNFMKRLQEKHPDLSLNERMMCAYIKMNLSSKEIAPLLNITIRGVETTRYRIRKKFDLQQKESLTEYLNTYL